MAQSVGTNLIYNIFRNITNILFPIITAPYVARVLGPECLGLANFANSYVGYFVLVAALGIPNYGIREVSKRRDNIKELSNIFSELFSINIVTSILTSLLFLLTIIAIDKLRIEYVIFLIAGISLFSSPFSIDWFFSGLEEFKYITIRSILVKTIAIVCLFLFVHSTDDLYIYILLSALAGCLNQFWNLLVLIKKGITIRFTLKGYNNHIKPLLLLFSSTIAVSLYTTINTVMLGFLTSYDQVSYYSQANSLSRTFLAVVTSMSEVMVPRLSFLNKSKDWKNINALVEKSFSMVSFIAFPMAIGTIMVAPIFIPIFLGNDFAGSIQPLQIISLIIIIIGFNNITTVQILLGLGFDSKLLYTVLWGTVINLILNGLLIPILGTNGAAISSVIAEVIILLVSVLYVKRYTPIQFTQYGELLKSLFGALSFIPLYLLVCKYLDGLQRLIMYTFLCAIIYYLIQLVLKSKSLIIIHDFVRLKFSRK